MKTFARWIAAGLVWLGSVETLEAAGWKAGVGRVAITPKSPTWMAGYAARKAPSDGVIHDLWAKSLLLEDADGGRALLVTLDVCGIDRDLSLKIRERIEAKHKIERARIALACSHTHSGPVLGENLITMYKIDAAQADRVKEYTGEFTRCVLESVDQAFATLAPAELAWGRGLVDLAVKARENAEAKVASLRSALLLKGPVDHDVPVLRVRSADGGDKVILCGYACHCTVLDINQINGDYAGFAQIAIEKAHPGAQAMFVAGCGADQNPQPRRGLPLAEKHGLSLANAVENVLAGPLRGVPAALSVGYEEVSIPFASVPTAEEVEAQTKDANFYVASRAKMLKRTLETNGKIAPAHPYPVQVWNLGEGEIAWVFLGGEVVVDYALRIKRNLDPAHVWVTAYANDVMAYIPSLRVLKEGGYEGGGAMVYYGRPSPWAESVEEDVFGALGRILKTTGLLK